MDKSEYLKKYLSDKNSSKTKKLKKNNNCNVKKHKGLTIIDEDIDLKKIAVKNTLDIYLEVDDTPLLVNVDEEQEMSLKFTDHNWVKDGENNKNNNQIQIRHDSDSDSGNPQCDITDELSSKTKDKVFKKARSNSSSSPDISPPRRNQMVKNATNSPQHESDISPPRKCTNYDSDSSPPRKAHKTIRDASSPDKNISRNHRGFSRKTEEIEVIYRDKTGKKRDLEKEKQEKELKEAKQKEKEAKYDQWGKGLKQKEIKEAQIHEVLHEVNKPLARYADDQDLDNKLKVVEREGDPMLEYMQKKKSKGNKAPSKPVYKGPEPLPNRFNIRPGYRWDGVDRSNGFEKQFFLKQNERKALKDIAYKWSTEDM